MAKSFQNDNPRDLWPVIPHRNQRCSFPEGFPKTKFPFLQAICYDISYIWQLKTILLAQELIAMNMHIHKYILIFQEKGFIHYLIQASLLLLKIFKPY